MFSKLMILTFVALGVAAVTAVDSSAASQVSSSTPTWSQIQKSRSLQVFCNKNIRDRASFVGVTLAAGITFDKALALQTGWD